MSNDILNKILSDITDKEQLETDERMMMLNSFADMALEYAEDFKFTSKPHQKSIASAYYNGMKTAYDLYSEKKWISVEEKLPNNKGEYLTLTLYRGSYGYTEDSRRQVIAKYSSDWIVPTGRHYNGSRVTHWMPLPNPPESDA